jgi:phosphohistidine phosphatase
MTLFLIRHAHAVDAQENPERPLSHRGRNQVRRMAKFLRKTDPQFRMLWHSPLARSKETAKLLIRGLGVKTKLMEVAGLEGGDDVTIIAAQLKTRRQPLAIVGHEPHLSALASLLVAGTAEPSRFVLKKCAVVALERGEGNWCVRWQVSPEIID